MITTLKNMLFPVIMELTSKMSNVESISSTEFGIYGYLKGKNEKPTLLNTCSDNYELLPCAELFPVIEKILTEAGIDYSVVYRMLDFSRFYADYTIKSGGISIGNSLDKIFPILRIEHSYNGLLKYKMTFGYFRMICTNGLTVPVEGMEESNIMIVGKHTKKILQSLEQLLDKVNYFVNNQDRYAEKFRILADRWVKNWEERIKQVIEATGVGKRGYDEIASKVREESALLNGGKVNDWLIYNAFNFHLYNARTADGKEYATAPNLRHESDRKVFKTIFDNPGKIKKAKTVKE